MKAQQLGRAATERAYALVFDPDDEVMSTLLAWARAERVTAASFTGIGAFRAVTLGYFDVALRDYLRIVLEEQVEVLSLAGNVALAQNEPKIHAHVVIGKRDGTAHGGHLLEARVRPTLELVLLESASDLHRRIDDATGLPLLHLKD
jgi:uncharacterized protein